jgi:hypothetical protein
MDFISHSLSARYSQLIAQLVMWTITEIGSKGGVNEALLGYARVLPSRN